MISIIIPTIEKNRDLLKDTVNHLIRNSDADNIELIIIPNVGRTFEQATNWGLQMATGDYLLFCNDDVLVRHKSWQHFMTEPFKNPEVGMVNGTGYNWKDLASFWFVMIRRDVFEKVGLLDENFTHFCSDHDYSMRVKTAGYKIHHLPPLPMITHLGSMTTKTLVNEKELIAKNKEIFFSKWGFK